VLYVLDTRSGAVLGTTAVGRVPAAAVDERTNRIFVANLRENTVSVLDAQTGHMLRTVGVGRDPWSLAVATTAGRVCVANASSNTISILDAQSGHVVRTVSVGLGPRVMAVDEGAGRVYVANMLAHAGPRRVDARQWAWQRWVQWLPFFPRPAASGPIPGSVSVVSIAR